MSMDRHRAERSVQVFHVSDIAPGALVLNLAKMRVEVNGIEGVFGDGPLEGEVGYRTMQSPDPQHRSAIVPVRRLGEALIRTALGMPEGNRRLH